MNLLNNYVLKNGLVYTNGKYLNVDIKVENGIITKMGQDLTADNVIDVAGKLVTDSFIDVHVHLRDPGYTHKEDINTGSMSAIKGGYSHIFAMPNTNPTMDNAQIINEFNQRVEKTAHCNVFGYAAITKGLKGEELTDVEGLSKLKIAGFSDDGKGVQDDEMMLNAIKAVASVDSIMSLHCEDESELGDVMGSMNLGTRQEELGEIGINNLSESNMVGRDVELLKQSSCRYHVCHVSTTETIAHIYNAQKQNLDVTGEVSPHHLTMCDQDITSLDTNFKMNPPLRSKTDQENVIKALNNSVLNIIATDHAPHSSEEKTAKFGDAPFGIVGLETAFSVLYSKLVLTQKVTLSTILDAMSTTPAKRFGVENFGIKVGNPANICVIDLDEKVTYNQANTKSKSSNSPFFNQEMQASIKMTLMDEKVYDWSKNV